MPNGDHNPITHAAALGVDAIAAGTILATLLGYLPEIAAILAILWYIIQIWESRTVQHWWRNRVMVRKAKKIARLRAREKVIVAQLAALEMVRAARHAAVELTETAKVEAAKQVVQEDTARATSENDAHKDGF